MFRIEELKHRRDQISKHLVAHELNQTHREMIKNHPKGFGAFYWDEGVLIEIEHSIDEQSQYIETNVSYPQHHTITTPQPSSPDQLVQTIKELVTLLEYAGVVHKVNFSRDARCLLFGTGDVPTCASTDSFFSNSNFTGIGSDQL